MRNRKRSTRWYVSKASNKKTTTNSDVATKLNICGKNYERHNLFIHVYRTKILFRFVIYFIVCSFDDVRRNNNE